MWILQVFVGLLELFQRIAVTTTRPATPGKRDAAATVPTLNHPAGPSGFASSPEELEDSKEFVMNVRPSPLTNCGASIATKADEIWQLDADYGKKDLYRFLKYNFDFCI